MNVTTIYKGQSAQYLLTVALNYYNYRQYKMYKIVVNNKNNYNEALKMMGTKLWIKQKLID